MTFEWRPHARSRTGRPGRPSRRARKRPKLRTQPTTAHARAVTRAVCIRSSSSASAGIPSSRLRKTTVARMRRSDFAGGGCLRSRRRRRGVVLPGPSPEPRRSAYGRPLRRPPGSLSAAFGLVVVAAVLVALVHVRELQRVVHPMHPKRRGKRRSRSRRRRSGRPGSLPSRGSHGSGRAEFPHPALRGTVFATRHGRTHGDGSGYRCSNRRIAVGGSPRCERRRSQCHHAQTTRYRKSQTRRRLPLRP